MPADDERGQTGGPVPTMNWHRMRQPAYLLGHLVVIVLFAASWQLGWWQWQRAELRGWNPQNLAYAFQWPVLGLMGLGFYLKMMRIELERDPAAEEPGVGVVLYQQPRVDTTGDPELAAYNAYLAELNERVLRGSRA